MWTAPSSQDRPETPGTRPDRRSYEEALAECGVLDVLAPFDPRIAGTPPPGNGVTQLSLFDRDPP